MTLVLVDIHEQIAVADALEAAGHTAARASLPLGDFQWMYEAQIHLVERKSVSDLLSSTNDGRLNRFIADGRGVLQQLGAERDLDLYRYLLVEGDTVRLPDYSGRRWDWEGVDNLLLSVQEAGVPVVRCPRRKVAERLLSLMKHVETPRRALYRPTPADPLDPYTSMKERNRVAFLMGVPGVGEDRARKLLRACRTPGEVLTLLDNVAQGGQSATALPKGVGTKTAKTANSFLWSRA
jgi:ERCC4-type nuclease